MNTYINKATYLANIALDDVKRNGQNGAMSAGGGSFNDLCGKIALVTGLKYDLVRQVAAGAWNDFWDNEDVVMRGLDYWPEGFHTWKV